GDPGDMRFEQRFGRLIGLDDSARWVVGEPSGHPLRRWYESANHLSAPGYRFALHERSFKAIMALVRRCGRDRGLLESTVRLPNLSRRARFEEMRERDEGVVPRSFIAAPLGDGLAAVGWRHASYPDEENFRWPD